MHGDWYIHLRVEDAGGGLDNAGNATVGIDLEDLTLGVGKDSEEVDDDILGLHVQHEGEGQRLSLSGGNLHIVADSGQVAEDTSSCGRILRQWLGSGQRSTNKGKLDRSILKVLHLNDRPRGVAIDELNTEARVGEVRGDIDLQVGGLGGVVGVGLGILWLLIETCQLPGMSFGNGCPSLATGHMWTWSCVAQGTIGMGREVDIHQLLPRRRTRRAEPAGQGSRT